MNPGERLKVWDLGCVGISAVLWTSFDWEDLLTLDPIFARARERHGEGEGAASRTEHLIFTMAHKTCHSENPVSRKIQKRLEVIHADTVRRLAEVEFHCRPGGCLGPSCRETEDVPGLLWVLLTDARDEVRRHGLYFVEGFALQAVKGWLRNRVEP
jgi:hypothetical protein